MVSIHPSVQSSTPNGIVSPQTARIRLVCQEGGDGVVSLLLCCAARHDRGYGEETDSWLATTLAQSPSIKHDP